MKKATYKIPFDKDGNQLSYDAYNVFSFVDNFEFEDTLQYVSYGKGRSSVTFKFKRKSNGKTVNMFLTDIDKIMNKLSHGEITGKFTFSKRGENYGCKLI